MTIERTECGKLGYPSRAAAMKGIAKHYKISKTHRRPYLCKECPNHVWHLTSRVERFVETLPRKKHNEFDE